LELTPANLLFFFLYSAFFSSSTLIALILFCVCICLCVFLFGITEEQKGLYGTIPRNAELKKNVYFSKICIASCSFLRLVCELRPALARLKRSHLNCWGWSEFTIRFSFSFCSLYACIIVVKAFVMKILKWWISFKSLKCRCFSRGWFSEEKGKKSCKWKTDFLQISQNEVTSILH
jgi:phosphatidylserine synthase